MDDSILATISSMLGVQADETHFDTDILVHINSAFNRLFELGVGPQDKPYYITGIIETWSDFWSDINTLQQLKEYIYLYVKYLFDPPGAGYTTTAIQEEIAKLEWLMYAICDNNRVDNFNENRVYQVGDKCIRSGTHYVRVTPSIEAGRWRDTDWKAYDYVDPTVPPFSVDISYVVGNKCTHENKYYVAITDIPAGAWNAENWVEYTP